MAPSRLAPSFARLDPFDGVKRLFSLERFLGVIRALLLAGFVGYFTYRTLGAHVADVAFGTGEFSSAGILARGLGKNVAWAAACLGLGLAGLDYLVVHRGFIRRNRMSKDEIKREYRESEGDPHVKAARRRAHQEALVGATVNSVKSATVLIVNPTHLATALRYDEEQDQAPVIVAQGEGELARRMIDAARAYGIPCVRDVPIARALRDLEIGDEIPEALYEAVAEIIRHVWETEKDGDRP
jgi:FlhB-like protein